MATHSWSSEPYHTDDASFRALHKSISDAILAVGLVRSSDTGQIDFGSVNRPSSSGDGGYEIFHFADDLHTTNPIFIKIIYGVGANQTQPRIKIHVGTGTDGTGTITGAYFTEATWVSPTSGGAGSALSYASSDGANLVLSLWPALTSNSFNAVRTSQLLVERSRDTDGAATADGLVIAYQSGSTAPQWHVMNHDNTRFARLNGYSPVTLPSQVDSVNTNVNPAFSLNTSADDAPVFYIPLACGGVPPWVCRGLVAMAHADGGASSLPVVPMYGDDVTFRSIAHQQSYAYGGLLMAGSGNQLSAAMYWED